MSQIVNDMTVGGRGWAGQVVTSQGEGDLGPIGCRADARVGVSNGSWADLDGSGHGEVKSEFLP